MMNINYIIEKYDKFFNGSRKHSAIQIYDNKRISIEQCMGITEFDENRIKIELMASFLVITGLELKMRNFNKYSVEIKGRIHSVNFEEK